MRIANRAVESVEVKGIKCWDLLGASAILNVAELATPSIAAIYHVKLLRYFIG